MLKSSVLGSLVLFPFIVVACGSDGTNEGGDPNAGAGGSNAAGAHSAGASGATVIAGTGGSGGSKVGQAGDNSAAGDEMGGSDDAGASSSTAGSGGSTAGSGGSTAGSGGHGGTAGGHGGTAGAAGSGGTSGHGGNAGSGGTSGHGGTAGSGGSSGHGGNAGSGGGSGAGGSSGSAGAAGGGAVCTTSAQCASAQVCVASVCRPCDSVAYSAGSTVYFVDPVNGNDSNGTGSAKSGGQAQNACAFKTITRALQVIGSPTQASGATVKLKGNASATTGETFPISVPQFVAIQGAAGPVTVTVPAGKVGFSFDGTGSLLKDLVLEGSGTSGIGVRVTTANVSAILDGVTVQNTAATAVNVTAGTLTLLAGTTIQMAGTSQARQEGITVEGTGKLVAKLTTGKVSVLKNTAQGIHVIGRGSVDLEGVVTSNTTGIPTTYAGTILISDNNDAAIELNQTGAAPPLNTLKGVLATGTVVGDGLLIYGGSAANVRKSVFVGNALSGIHLLHTGNKQTGNNDVSAVDLGKAADLGLNVLQGAQNQLNNDGAGLCIDLDPTLTMVIAAQGNVFAPADCSATATPLTKNFGMCAAVNTKLDDLGWAWVAANTTSKVTVDVTKCN
ncbi:MAG: hypothetical protein ABIQ16_22455 [Polyangiaceae bacterium]